MKLSESKLRRIIREELSEARGSPPPLGTDIAYEFGGLTMQQGQLTAIFDPANAESGSANIPEEYMDQIERQAKQVTRKVSHTEVYDHGGVTRIAAYIDAPSLTAKEIKKFELTEIVL